VSRLATSFVLGYHSCDATVAKQAINNGVDILNSDQDYDWLGPGAYFWESDPRRALEWARSKKLRKPAVIGAVIDLRNRLDLVSRSDLQLLKEAHELFLEYRAESGLPIPQNRPATGRADSGNALSFLDCAVIRHLHGMMEEQSQEPFDPVRNMFSEGRPLYPESGFRNQSHVQVAVRNSACILGVFLPRPYPGKEIDQPIH
jgi:hypothetical protein